MICSEQWTPTDEYNVELRLHNCCCIANERLCLPQSQSKGNQKRYKKIYRNGVAFILMRLSNRSQKCAVRKADNFLLLVRCQRTIVSRLDAAAAAMRRKCANVIVTDVHSYRTRARMNPII